MTLTSARRQPCPDCAFPNVLLREQPLEAHLPAGSAASETRSQRKTLSAPAVATKGSHELFEPPPYNQGTESDEHE